MLFDWLFAIFRAAGFRGENAKDTVGVANGGDFRVSGDDGFISKVKRHQRTGFNACRGITDDEIEFHFLQFFENLVDAFASQSVFIPGLGSRENVEIFRALIFNQRLVQCGIALNDVDEIINDATFAAHNQVEVTQADVEVDNDGFLSLLGQTCSDGRAGGGLANAPLPEVTTIMRAIEIPC